MLRILRNIISYYFILIIWSFIVSICAGAIFLYLMVLYFILCFIYILPSVINVVLGV